MTIDRRKLRWNGWGFIDHDFDLGDNAERIWSWLATELGRASLPERPARSLEDIEVPASAFDGDELGQLAAIVGEAQVKVDAYERAFHARGKSYADLIRLRSGDLDTVPDAVVYPRDAEAAIHLLAWAQTHAVAVVPYGGGSSVVGGVTAQRGPGQRAVLTVDTTLLANILEIDPVSLTATIEAGIYGPALEHGLSARGYTLGHLPQSFEFSTLGGWIAARGAGQQSNRYGRAEDWLVSARIATPGGVWRTEAFPATAAGPDLNEFVVGSEGVLGIITQASVRIHPRPAAQDYRGWLFKSFDRGVEAVRAVIQHGLPVAMIRLSDAAETRFFSTFAGLRKPRPMIEQLAERALGLGGYGEHRCMMLLGVEGEARNVKVQAARASELVREHGGFPLGHSAGASWRKTRFAMPYLRDPLLDRGIGVDTLETSTRWSNLESLHRRVVRAIDEALRDNAVDSSARAMVMAHISHAYEDGASLYFTFVFPQAAQGREFEQWQAVKVAASEAIVAGGGTISHHHGVGTDHAQWLPAEKGEIGMGILGALKHEVDPHGILNPGKLVVAKPRQVR